ncbi:hypothetical protein AC478_01000 [miscellaneous Crenarchaeota group-1 archaeon SG8-32-3]|uniref:Uncharacterized protein n=1 Tax=miscellaneous Crenarchaeota group-1 archaeon SG8-32-3 TaxID=1685125 RepID=A0A0M0BUQ8_9ARCH|nr:MAG: hypothetical protein AC478_01000 [miscellaneous Crenarchaeota group-1 archaeon SG8-32-3]
MLLNKKTSKYITLSGLLLSACALLVSTLLGFGGFNIQAFSSYVMTGYVSKLQMVFLILVGLGLLLSGVAYFNQAKKQKIKKPSFVLLPHLAVSIVFFAMSIFGLTSQLRGTDFWGETTFEEIQATLFFNTLTLTSFIVLGVLQIILSIIFFKTKMLQQHQLSKTAKNLTLASGILLVIKTILDYPLIKEAVFVLSFMLKIPFPNNILSIIVPVIYLSAQIPLAVILLHNQNLRQNNRKSSFLQRSH